MSLKIMDILRMGQIQLKEKGIEAHRLEAEMLMCHLLECQRHQLYIDGYREVTPVQCNAFFDLIKRRTCNVPIQYILGSQEFMGLDFLVDERVLIPRGDTETLVEMIINYAKSIKGDINILDLGTGSGAISVSLAKLLPQSHVVSVDIDGKALEVARQNALCHGVSDRIIFMLGDLFCSLDEDKYKGFFDILVSNPPYIPTGDIDELSIQVKDYEPRIALDGGEDGLDFYKRIADGAPRYLKQKALLAVEVGYNQSRDVAAILDEIECYNNIRFYKDLSGINRVVAANVEF